MISYSCCNIIPTLFLLLSLFSYVSSSNFNNTDHNQSRFESEKIEEYLKTINKPALKTIKSPDGDLIDCVLFHQQPAFDNPLLQGHKPITDLPPIPKEFLSDNNESTFDEQVFQVWKMSGESCPDNTIPIRRITEEDVLRTFKRKQEVGPDGYVHEHATGFVKGSFSYSSASINVWKPEIEKENELSLSQLWVMAGTLEDGDRNSVEVGYKVVKGGSPRLFIYWTADAYKNTGCYNLQCHGFVQRNKNIVLGGTLSVPISKYDGPQYELRCLVWKNPWDANWWLVINGLPVGYWPWQLFTLLGEKGLAKQLHFGGEVAFSPSSGEHTTSTGMGSGHFPKGGFRKAAYIGHILVIEEKNRVVTSPELKTYTSNKKYYKAEAFLRKKPYVEAYVFYGGPQP